MTQNKKQSSLEMASLRFFFPLRPPPTPRWRACTLRTGNVMVDDTVIEKRQLLEGMEISEHTHPNFWKIQTVLESAHAHARIAAATGVNVS